MKKNNLQIVMYNYDLKITIISDDVKIKEFVSSIQPEDNFNHLIKQYSSVSTKLDLMDTDIIIVDGYEEYEKLMNGINDDAKVILITNEEIKNENGLDFVLSKPISYTNLKVAIRTILRTLKQEADLHYNSECLRTVIDSVPDMFWIKSLDGIHTMVNNEFCTIVGKQMQDVIGKDHYYIWNVSKDDPNSGAELCKESEAKVIAAGKTLASNERVKSQNGMRSLIAYKSPLKDKLGNIIGTIGLGHDITEQENLIIENKILLDSMPYAVLIKDNQGIIKNVNACFEKTFGVKPEEVIGKSYDDWCEITFYPGRTVNSEGYLEGTTFTIHGENKKMELRSANIINSYKATTGIICIFRDVTLVRQLEDKIIANSNIDFMTGLYNRRFLDNYINNLNEGSSLSFIAIDLDHFKNINDTYGHKAGDEALIITSKILRNCFPSDVIVRMGGDEFLIVKVGSFSISELENNAEFLLSEFFRNFAHTTVFKGLSASIGISQGTLIHDSADDLIKNSDAALYQAKEAGRGCFKVFDGGEKLTRTKLQQV